MSPMKKGSRMTDEEREFYRSYQREATEKSVAARKVPSTNLQWRARIAKSHRRKSKKRRASHG